MKINWKNLAISFLIGFPLTDEVCDVSTVKGDSFLGDDGEKIVGERCAIASVLVYGGSFAIVLLSTVFFYFLLSYLQKRKTSKKVE